MSGYTGFPPSHCDKAAKAAEVAKAEADLKAAQPEVAAASHPPVPPVVTAVAAPGDAPE